LPSYLAGDAFGDGDALVRGQVPGCGVEGEAEAFAVDLRGGGHRTASPRITGSAAYAEEAPDGPSGARTRITPPAVGMTPSRGRVAMPETTEPGCGVEGEAEALAVDQRGGGHRRRRRTRAIVPERSRRTRRRRREAGGCAVTPAIRRQASSATASR
jgi:hypothetical protein